ncbi:MAG: FHA domain-containing protein [bacterium]|nr:FHA domain-containing protein [bacterium]
MSDGAYGLKVLNGIYSGQVAELFGQDINLGSGSKFEYEEGAVYFPDPGVARLHAVLLWDAKENVYHISNRSPISPVLLDNKVCGHGRLIPGAKIQMGDLQLEVVALGDVKPAVTDTAVSYLQVNSGGSFLGEQVETAPAAKPAWLTSTGGAMVSHIADIPIISQDAPAEESRSSEERRYTPEPEPVSESAPAPAPEPEPMPIPQGPIGRLKVIKGANKGQSMEVTGTITIGRSPECGLVLADGSVSRKHCSIECNDDGTVYLVNHSTGNTTKAGKKNVRDRFAIETDMEITLGKVILSWTFC